MRERLIWLWLRLSRSVKNNFEIKVEFLRWVKPDTCHLSHIIVACAYVQRSKST